MNLLLSTDLRSSVCYDIVEDAMKNILMNQVLCFNTYKSYLHLSPKFLFNTSDLNILALQKTLMTMHY